MNENWVATWEKSSKGTVGMRGVLEALDAVFDFIIYAVVLIDVLKVPYIVARWFAWECFHFVRPKPSCNTIFNTL